MAIKKVIQDIKTDKAKKALHVRVKVKTLEAFNRICKAEKLTKEELIEAMIEEYNQ